MPSLSACMRCRRVYVPGRYFVRSIFYARYELYVARVRRPSGIRQRNGVCTGEQASPGVWGHRVGAVQSTIIMTTIK